ITAPVRLKDFDGDIKLTEDMWPSMVDFNKASGSAGGDTVYRLREGIERFFITDINNPGAGTSAQSTIAVSWDTFGNPEHAAATAGIHVFNHVPGGCNVLYMDGHVQFVRYPGRFPIVNDDGILKENGHFGLY
ncbi:MAG: hypothetical protein KAH38_06415, partial [Candidatus Hydrogenedentes bacterium]|nr:hypothetical protein [Candidatus Hydrogenedentota bacterium]